jgi:NOL1/NOP2/fmu family ribosome biogenesis protein
MTTGRVMILNDNHKKEIEKSLENQFGIRKIKDTLIKRGKDKIYLYQGSLTEKEIIELTLTFPVEGVGVYIGRFEKHDFKLSIEGTQLLKNQITKNIFEIDDKQLESWMLGQELNINSGKKGLLVMKHGEDFLGCGKASEEKIGNFIPKSRRLKYKE